MVVSVGKSVTASFLEEVDGFSGGVGAPWDNNDVWDCDCDCDCHAVDDCKTPNVRDSNIPCRWSMVSCGMI